MKDNCFVDTNIFVYFRDAEEPEKQKTAARYLTILWENQTGRISYQVLNEYYTVVTRKLKPGLSSDAARKDIRNLMLWDPVVVDQLIIEKGWEIQDQYQLSWWDSLIVSAALKSGCSTLLTEDLQDGQSIENLTIINPFNPDNNAFLKYLTKTV